MSDTRPDDGEAGARLAVGEDTASTSGIAAINQAWPHETERQLAAYHRERVQGLPADDIAGPL